MLVNNAGITRDAVLHRMTEEQWNEVIHVNLASIFNMTRNVIEGMRERNYGRIVNISFDQRPEGPDRARPTIPPPRPA